MPDVPVGIDVPDDVDVMLMIFIMSNFRYIYKDLH